MISAQSFGDKMTLNERISGNVAEKGLAMSVQASKNTRAQRRSLVWKIMLLAITIWMDGYI